MKYTLCQQCAIVIMYNDTSAVTPVELGHIDSFLESTNTTLMYLGHDDNKTFICDCCCVGIDEGIARYFEENK